MTGSEMGFAGQLLMRGETQFDQARVGRVFNARRPERQPAAVLLAAGESDIVGGVRLATERGWEVAVRAGGHSWAAWSVRDGTLLIDLGDFRQMSYDESTGIVTVTPSVRGGSELAPFLAERGRFFAGGHCPTVGLGGFLLQGGMGWNCRGWGWAAESVVGIDVVTADGSLVRADADQNSDLYWAARGAGPSFPGVIVRFHLATRQHPGYVAETVHLYPMEVFDEVMTWLHDTHHTFSSDVEIVVIANTPPEPIPGHEGCLLAVTGVAMVGTPEQARAALEPLATCPVIDQAILRIDAVPVSFDDLRLRQVMANPEGHRYRVDNAWLAGEASDVVPAIRRAFVELPTAQSFTIWFSMAPQRELPDMALSLQTDIYVATYVVSTDPDRDEELRDWVDSAMTDMQPVTVGQYLGDSDLLNRQVKFMTDDSFTRLQQIRNHRDPDHRFVSYLTTDNAPLNTNHWERP
jgi:hypothetical protein